MSEYNQDVIDDHTRQLALAEINYLREGEESDALVNDAIRQIFSVVKL